MHIFRLIYRIMYEKRDEFVVAKVIVIGNQKEKWVVVVQKTNTMRILWLTHLFAEQDQKIVCIDKKPR